MKDVIDKTLINKVIAELSVSSLPTRKTITTRYKWNAACQELFEYHFNNVHGEGKPRDSSPNYLVFDNHSRMAEDQLLHSSSNSSPTFLTILGSRNVTEFTSSVQARLRIDKFKS